MRRTVRSLVAHWRPGAPNRPRLPLALLTIACVAALAVGVGCKRREGTGACRAGDLVLLHPAVRLDQTLPPREARLAVLGTTFVAVWSAGSDIDSDLFARAVNADGVAVSNEVRLTDIAGRTQHPRLATGAGTLAIAWQDDRLGRLDAFAAVLGTAFGPVLGQAFVPPVISPGQKPEPAIAAFGTAFRLVWNGPGPDGFDHLWSAGVGLDGSATAPALLVPSLEDRPQSGPAAAALGTAFVFADAESRVSALSPPDVFTYVVAGTGAVAAVERFAPSSSARRPEIAALPPAAGAGGGAGVLWCDARNGHDQLFFGALDPGGVSVPERQITYDAADACDAGLAAGEGFFLAAWNELDAAGRHVQFSTLHADGRPDRLARTIASDDGGDAELHRPDVAWNGRVAGVSWVSASGGVWFQPLECTLGDFPTPAASGSPTPTP